MITIKELLIHTSKFPSIMEIFKISSGFNIFSGPCAVENINQMEIIANKLYENNLKFMRGGAFKPRTSPYEFQGLGIEGLKILKHVCKKYSLISVSEILDPRDVEKSQEYIDIIQVGSRNMNNTALLKEVGKTNRSILLKRGLMSTLKEFLLATEYIVSCGNQNVILCERGIRTFEDSTRNTLDISSVAIIKKETSLPVIIDLSHSLGRKDIVVLIAKAAMALGVDGLMLEVHNNPSVAFSDSKQQLSLDEFQLFLNEIIAY